MKHVLLGDLEQGKKGVPVFAGMEFATAWSAFDYVVLEGKEEFDAAGGDSYEEGYVVLDDEGAELESRGGESRFRAKVDGTGVLLAPVGPSHAVINTGERRVRLLRVRVKMEKREHLAVSAADVDAGVLEWRDAIHGGVGRIATRHIWGPDDFVSPWTFLDHAVLEQGSSVGFHYHDALEESFVVLRGRGYMTVDDETFAVGPGSVTWQGVRQGHGIYNPHAEELEFLRLAVARPDQEYTSIDLHDDLAGRRPGP